MELSSAIAVLRQNGKIITNVYSDEVLNAADEILFSDGAILVSYEDHGIRRLYYYAHSIDKIGRRMNDLKFKEYTLEFMTRDNRENRDELLSLGFTPYASLMRMSTKDCSNVLQAKEICSFYDADIGKKPSSDDALMINQILWKIFDTRISHLLSDEEVTQAIERGEFTIYRDDHSRIRSILQVVSTAKRFYINQIYNGADKQIIHAMLLNRLKNYIDQGGKYAYAWVERDNVASVKFHGKYGFFHDGMWNMVYELKNDKS